MNRMWEELAEMRRQIREAREAGGHLFSHPARTEGDGATSDRSGDWSRR